MARHRRDDRGARGAVHRLWIKSLAAHGAPTAAVAAPPPLRRGRLKFRYLSFPHAGGGFGVVRGVVVSPKQTLVEQVKIRARSAPCEFRRSSEARFGIRRYLGR